MRPVKNAGSAVRNEQSGLNRGHNRHLCLLVVDVRKIEERTKIRPKVKQKGKKKVALARAGKIRPPKKVEKKAARVREPMDSV